KGDKKGKPEGDAEGKKAPPKEQIPAPPARLYEYFKNVVRPAMKKAFGYPNDNAVPKVAKIVLNMGVGRARENPKMLEALAADMVEFFNGINIVLNTSANSDKEALELLRVMGFPFRGLEIAGISGAAGAK